MESCAREEGKWRIEILFDLNTPEADFPNSLIVQSPNYWYQSIDFTSWFWISILAMILILKLEALWQSKNGNPWCLSSKCERMFGCVSRCECKSSCALTQQCLKESTLEDTDDTLDGIAQLAVLSGRQAAVVLFQQLQRPVSIWKTKENSLMWTIHASINHTSLHPSSIQKNGYPVRYAWIKNWRTVHH